jgi:hypothetical protein
MARAAMLRVNQDCRIEFKTEVDSNGVENINFMCKTLRHSREGGNP